MRLDSLQSEEFPARTNPRHNWPAAPGGEALLEPGCELDDDTYRRRHKIDPASIEAGVFMRDLTDADVIAHVLSNQGVALSRQGKLQDVIARYDAALELHPTLVAAHYNRGLDLMNAGRLQEALASFDRAIELHPADAQAHNNRGLTKLKLGDREGKSVTANFETSEKPTEVTLNDDLTALVILKRMKAR